jgi:NAD(P)-dependent dehydrogenase (short-subunit alcohol dehydrogenase family)
MSKLKGKVAIVTGAASGIGLACARRYIAEGATVVGVDLRETDDWSALQAQTPFHQVDVTDTAALKAVAETTVRDFDRCGRRRWRTCVNVG